MTGFLEPWMDPLVWSDTWQPLPLHLGPQKDICLKINHYSATKEDITEFKDRGYWISPQIIDNETIKLLKEETTRVFKGEVDFPNAPYQYEFWINSVRNHYHNHPAVRKINNVCYVNNAYKQLVRSEAIGSIAAQLLDTDEIRLWHDQAIWKPGEGKEFTQAGNIGWHQDYGFWHVSNTSNMITAWIPLQDVDLENGSMRTIVGSHKWGSLKDSGMATFFEKDMDKLKDKFVKEATSPWEEEPCIMKAGQVVFHHALTLHGSGPNISDLPRLAAVLHLMPKACGYAPGNGHHHTLKALGPTARAGTLFEGDNFPLLYKKK